MKSDSHWEGLQLHVNTLRLKAILVVDDHQQLSSALQWILTDEDSLPDVAFDAQAAIRNVNAHECDAAISIASVEGAETKATIGILAESAFCMISKDARPLTRSMHEASGSSRSRKARPITLSTALCRPISSLTKRGLPSRPKMPAA